jgi:hypothetical protein
MKDARATFESIAAEILEASRSHRENAADCAREPTLTELWALCFERGISTAEIMSRTAKYLCALGYSVRREGDDTLVIAAPGDQYTCYG